MTVLFLVVFISFLSNINAFSPRRVINRVNINTLKCVSSVDDKVEVEEYFNNEGFNRWNKIYSESDEVNSVQKDIRTGHQQTIDKVLNWLDDENNSKKTLCDAGCGVGSLALPVSSGFKKVFASDISKAMTTEAAARAKSNGIKNVKFTVSDMEALKGNYDTVTCIDVMIHYPTEKLPDIIGNLGRISNERLILSFAPKNIFYDTLKKVGEFFPGPSKTTRAYLHPEDKVIAALKKEGFTIKRKEMTSTNFYFSRLLEAVREERK